MFYSCFTQRPHCFWNLLKDFMHAGEKTNKQYKKKQKKTTFLQMNALIIAITTQTIRNAHKEWVRFNGDQM